MRVEMLEARLPGRGRNPLSIQVCFNRVRVAIYPNLLGRNPLSIQVCFNSAIFAS